MLGIVPTPGSLVASWQQRGCDMVRKCREHEQIELSLLQSNIILHFLSTLASMEARSRGAVRVRHGELFIRDGSEAARRGDHALSPEQATKEG